MAATRHRPYLAMWLVVLRSLVERAEHSAVAGLAADYRARTNQPGTNKSCALAVCASVAHARSHRLPTDRFRCCLAQQTMAYLGLKSRPWLMQSWTAPA
jgi:hypothetical protein